MYRSNILFSTLSFLKEQLPAVSVLAVQEYTPVSAASLRFPAITVSVEDMHDAEFELGNDDTWEVLIQNYILGQNLVQQQGLMDMLLTLYRTKSVPVLQVQQGGQVQTPVVGYLVFDRVINTVDVPLPKDTTITSSYYFVGSVYTRFLFYLLRGDL